VLAITSNFISFSSTQYDTVLGGVQTLMEVSSVSGEPFY
jgi:hypothetical protein